MPNTKQAAAIAGANVLMTMMGQFEALRSQGAEVVKQYNSEGWNSVWDAMQTRVQNADGTLGTVDGTPNVAHPIDVTSYVTLNRAASATQLIAAITLLNDFSNFLSNVAVAAAQRTQTIDDLVS